MKKIALIADIHGNFLALQKVVEDIKRRGTDTVFNLGDHISGPLWPKETIEFIMNQKNWINISGNHDRQLITQNPETHGPSDRYAYQFLTDSEKEWLKNLPAKMVINNEFFLFHGIPENDELYLLETIENGRIRVAGYNEINERIKNSNKDIKVFLCGHSHHPRVVNFNGNIIINPGSIGLQAYALESPVPHIAEVGSPNAHYAVLEKVNEEWIVDIISVPYDKTAAVKQAEKNQAFEWAAALKTGYAVPV